MIIIHWWFCGSDLAFQSNGRGFEFGCALVPVLSIVEGKYREKIGIS